MERNEVVKWLKQVKNRISEKEPGYGLNKLPSIKKDVDSGNIKNTVSQIKRLNDGYGAYRKDSDVPNYDEILQRGELKNKIGEIVWMSPAEYIRRTKDGFGQTTMDMYIRGFDSKAVAEYANAMYDGDMFPLTVLDYSGLSFSQEGRHRSFASYILEVKQIPVLVIKNKEGYEEPEEEPEEEPDDSDTKLPIEPGKGDLEIFDLLGIDEDQHNPSLDTDDVFSYLQANEEAFAKFKEENEDKIFQASNEEETYVVHRSTRTGLSNWQITKFVDKKPQGHETRETWEQAVDTIEDDIDWTNPDNYKVMEMNEVWDMLGLKSYLNIREMFKRNTHA